MYPDAAKFFRWVKAGFGQPRKQLRNTLAAGLNMPKPEAEATARHSIYRPYPPPPKH